MDNILQKRKSLIINFLYFGIFAGLYYVFIKYALGYVFPFIFAAALAVFLQKPIKAITNKLHIKDHSVVATIVVLLIVVAIIGTAGYGLYVLINELKSFLEYLFSHFNSLADIINTAREFIMGIVVKLPAGISETAGGYVTDFFNKIGTHEMSLDLSVLSTPLSGAWHVVKGIPSLFLTVIVTIISAVFITADYEDIKKLILSMCSVEKGKKIVNSKRTVFKGVGKLFKAYATLMLITFTEMLVGLYFMKAIGLYNGGYIAIISFVICVVDIVPVLGTGTVLIPWALYMLITGNVGFAIGLGILYGVVTVLRQVIEPKLVANQVGFPAIISIMAMFIGAKLFGAFGIIILPLTVIILKLMYDEGIILKKPEKTLLDVDAEESVAVKADIAEDGVKNE